MTFVPKIKKRITLTHIKLDTTERYFRLESAMVQGDEVPNSTKKPPFLIQVTELSTGEVGQIIAPKILESELRKHYPDDAYVGKCFALSVTPPVEGGKKYNLVNITEIDDPLATATDAPKADKAPKK